MSVDPVLAPFLPGPLMPQDIDFPAWRAEGEVGAQALLDLVAEPGPEVAERHLIEIPVPGGSIEIAVYRPERSTTLPVHLYFHGGGWVAGSARSPFTEILARERAVGARCVVVAVNYRKAPEHQAPIPLLDCQAALYWVVEHAEELGVDRTLITVGGGSAGANLAAALMLKIRDERGPQVALQLLEVPALDLTLSLPSHSDPELGSKYMLHRPDMERFAALYLGEHGDPGDPYVSPLLAPDLSGLPPAYIMSSEFDLLRDDGQAYADRLRNAGVPAAFSLQRGHVHPSPAFTKIMPSARAWREEALDVLRAVHAGTLDLAGDRDDATA